MDAPSKEFAPAGSLEELKIKGRAFEERLRGLGYINITIEFRNAEGDVDGLPDLAADLVHHFFWRTVARSIA